MSAKGLTIHGMRIEYNATKHREQLCGCATFRRARQRRTCDEEAVNEEMEPVSAEEDEKETDFPMENGHAADL